MDDHPIKFLLKRATDTDYHTPDDRFTAERSGTDLRITDTEGGETVLLKNYADGDFGILLKDIPQDPSREPFDLLPDAPTWDAVHEVIRNGTDQNNNATASLAITGDPDFIDLNADGRNDIWLRRQHTAERNSEIVPPTQHFHLDVAARGLIVSGASA